MRQRIWAVSYDDPGEGPAVPLKDPPSTQTPDTTARILGFGVLLCALVFYGSFMLGFERHSVPKEFVLCLGAWGGGLHFLLRRPCWSTERVLTSLGGMFVVVALVATLGVTNGWFAMRALTTSVSAVVVFVLALALAREKQAERLLWFVALAAVAAALTALLEATRLVPEISMTGRGPGGVAGNRNFLSHLLVIGTMPIVLEIGRQGDRVKRTLWVTGLACVVAAITLSRSRGSWLASMAMLGCSIAVLLLRRFMLRAESSGIAGAIAVALLLGTTSGVFVFNKTMHWSTVDFQSTFARLGDHRTGTGRGRMVQYAASLRMVADHPVLGVGPGQWSIAYPSYAHGDDPTYPPNAPLPMNRLPSSDWIGLAAENGLVQVGVVIALGVALALRALRGGILANDHAAALLLVLVALAVVGTVDGVLYRADTAYAAALVVGALAGSCTPALARDFHVPRVPALVVISVGFLVAVGSSGSKFLASILRSDGATADLERAFRFDPGNFVLAAEIAQRHSAFGQCDVAASYARTSLRLCPKARLPQTILDSCTGHD